MTMSYQNSTDYLIKNMVQASFSKIAPFWPLQNIIAVNPLQGFEMLAIEDAITQAQAFFEQKNLPSEMEDINRHTIKWLQIYSDEGQATIKMPSKNHSFYLAWLELVVFDKTLHRNHIDKTRLLSSLSKNSSLVIEEYLEKLSVPIPDRELFLTLLLTTLSGWASYVKYKTDWSHSLWSQEDYLAVRLVTTYLLWPEAKKLLDWHRSCLSNANNHVLENIQIAEENYRLNLLRKISHQKNLSTHIPAAQLIFCIDVRSEPFRAAVESVGDYETYGFAGFFGVPVTLYDQIGGESYHSCPVLLQPSHVVTELPCSDAERLRDEKGYYFVRLVKKFYHSLKYNFTTPFVVAEAVGCFAGLWMAFKSLAPNLSVKAARAFHQLCRPSIISEPSLSEISLDERCRYAESALKTIGLTSGFSPLIIFCGHGSHTENNAYASALDCGACGGRRGGSNAKILASILNQYEVRAYLLGKNIVIPELTRFIAAEHNTTTDQVTLYIHERRDDVENLQRDLDQAREINSRRRLSKLGVMNGGSYQSMLRSHDWAQVRPEWGLTGNAAFIVAPRALTRNLDLDGRCFLHSYDYRQDPDGGTLAAILTAPMVVAQWINCQYLFSSINNVAYGGGSKVTKNITGKIGIMQGNASDLMTGLPLQSLCYDDVNLAHSMQRLLVLVLAPQSLVAAIIRAQAILQRLFANGWVQMVVIEPEDGQQYMLSRDLSWQAIN